MGDKELKRLEEILETNNSLQSIFTRASGLNLPNWYLGSGCVSQTVWNYFHGFDPELGIKDYDLVYYDREDVSYEGEDAFIKRGKGLFGDIPVPVEIRNQARVHLWYGKKYIGRSIDQHESVEASISTWPTTATSIGVRKVGGRYSICAPFGLDDLFALTVRANKGLITEKIYQDKVERWVKIWPRLNVIPWGDK